MINSLAKFTALLGAGSVLFAAITPAIATPPPDVFQDSRGNVYVYGTTLTDLGSNPQFSTSAPLVRRAQSGYCGEIRLTSSTSLPNLGNTWSVEGNLHSRVLMPSLTNPDQVPTCRNGQWTPELTVAMLDAGGFVDNSVAGRDRVFLLGYTSGVTQAVTFNDVSQSQRLRVNACGFARISNTAANPLADTLRLGEYTYLTDTLPVAVPPLCRREGEGYERYTPDSWN